jgi:PadR family transcriptional regulator, phenolic acid-responsive transcriptional regulator
MSLKHTILGFLNHQDYSGYDLQKKIENTINHFWPSTQSQVYRTLKELVDDGHIFMQIIYQDNKPNKKKYSIREEGKRELDQWLKTQMAIPNHRNQFLVQLFFSDSLDNTTIISNLKHYKSTLQKRLSFLTGEQVDKNIKGSHNDKKKILVRLTVQNGIWALENEIRWVEHAMNILQDEK